MEKYAAGIVLYHPEIERLKENIDAICKQVKLVYCYNNGLHNSNEINNLLEKYENIRLIGYGKNIGVAAALNKILKEAEKDGIEWILTLDQDSVVCDGMIEALARFKNERKVAIICPLIEDVRRKNEIHIAHSNTISDIDFCITSGSFMNISKILSIGGFDEWLFVGLVDNEICYRTKLYGYRIIRDNSVTLNHELGNLTPSKFEKFYLKLGSILQCDTLKKLSYKRQVSPMRLFFATRNMIYLENKYKGQDVDAWSKKTLVKNSISSFLRGQNKIKIIKSVYYGIIEGIKKGKE